MSYSGLLNITCTVQELTEAQSATGKISQVWTDLITGVKCRLDTAYGRETLTTTGKFAVATHKLFIEYSTGLLDEKTNRIKIGTNYFDILMVADGGGQNHHFELLLQRIY
jgi:head-tail adaptor